MRCIVVSSLLALAVIPAAHALPNCTAGAVPAPLASAQTLQAPVAQELFSNTTPLGAPSGVLAHAYDEALSVDRVLLRLHVQAIGHPILGCEFYGGEFASAADRLLLHATDLRFVNPVSGEEVFVESQPDF